MTRPERVYNRAQLANLKRTDAEVAANRARLRPTGVKTCNRCHEERPFSDFGEDRSRPDGLWQACRPCRFRHLVGEHEARQAAEAEQDRRLSLPERVAKEALHAARD